jgi:hypothetical protein
MILITLPIVDAMPLSDRRTIVRPNGHSALAHMNQAGGSHGEEPVSEAENGETRRRTGGRQGDEQSHAGRERRCCAKTQQRADRRGRQEGTSPEAER